MTLQNIAITSQQAAFIEQLVSSGEYKNASEVLTKGLHLLEEHLAEQAAKLEVLRAEIQKGIDDIEAGRYTTFNSAKELADNFRTISKQIITSAKHENIA